MYDYAVNDVREASYSPAVFIDGERTNISGPSHLSGASCHLRLRLCIAASRQLGFYNIDSFTHNEIVIVAHYRVNQTRTVLTFPLRKQIVS